MDFVVAWHSLWVLEVCLNCLFVVAELQRVSVLGEMAFVVMWMKILIAVLDSHLKS
jgi:hypothetical protein